MNAKTSHDAQHLHPRWPPSGAVGAERFGKPPASLDKSNLRAAQFPDLSEIDQRVFPLILNIRWKKKTKAHPQASASGQEMPPCKQEAELHFTDSHLTNSFCCLM